MFEEHFLEVVWPLKYPDSGEICPERRSGRTTVVVGEFGYVHVMFPKVYGSNHSLGKAAY